MFPYGIVAVAVASLRQEPTHRAEQVSQLLFGECVEILSQTRGQWVQIRSDWDDYEGWILVSQLVKVPFDTYRKKTVFYSSGIKDQLLLPSGKGTLRLSPGSDLFLMRKNSIHWYCQPLAFKGKRLNTNKAVYTDEALQYWAKLFLGTPYLWGGRSINGIDCSGLSQIVFKLLGYRLPRDARQQAIIGKNIDFLQDARCGDLAFFDNEAGVINHVGILLNNTTIIHATESAGRVVMDAIDVEGIISTTRHVRTHKLRFINRYF